MRALAQAAFEFPALVFLLGSVRFVRDEDRFAENDLTSGEGKPAGGRR